MSIKSLGAFVLTICAITAFADTVEFKSGAKLTGKVVKIVGGEIVFNSDDVGEVKIKEDKVASLVTEKANTVQYNDKTTQDGVIAMKDGKYTLEGKDLNMADVKAVNPEIEKWHGSVNFSGTASRGNTVSEKATILAALNRSWEKDRFSSALGYYYSQSGTSKENKEKTEDRFELTAQEDHFWATKVYSYLNFKYERDGINNLEHRYRFGLGIGYQWLDGYNHEATGAWSFKQEAGMTYVLEKYESLDRDTYPSFRYAHNLKWVPRWVEGFAVTHNFEYLPDTEDWANNYLLNTDIGFTKDLVGGWQLIGLFEWDYNSMPAPGTKKSDLRYTIGLGYKW
jgi:putative salt-induced outer membrane protein YdiY